MTAHGSGLVREQHGDVLVLRLDRPEARNAIDPTMMAGLAGGVDDAERDGTVRAVVITGTGDRAFSAGMDLRSFVSDPGDAGPVPPTFLRLLAGQVTVPVLTAVNGVAVGAGFELVLGSDVVVAASHATFGLPEVKRGLFAGSGVMHIAKRLPLGVALELALTGDRIDADRAHHLGLANAVVDAADVMGETLRLAHAIAANAPLGLAATKELIRKSAYAEPDAEARQRQWQATVFNSEDAREGALAFIEKRPPVWQGR